jgi:replicative DNA helicase
MSDLIDRIPPQNLEAEMAVLGACLVDRDLIADVAGILSPRDFHAPMHGTIFEAITRLADSENPVDKISVAEELKRRGELETCGGLSYLSSLMDTVQTAQSASYYAKIVREKSVLRDLIVAGTKITQLAYEGEEDAEGTIAQCDSVLRSATERGVRRDEGMTAHEAALAVYRDLHAGRSGAQFTPWAKVNEYTGGFFPGEMALWCAAPGMGKTGAIIDLADYVAAHHECVLFFTLEMAIKDVMRRMFAMYSNVPARALRRGDLRDSQYDSVADAASYVGDRNIRFYGRPKSCADIRAVVSRVSREVKIGSIVIDHIGCLEDVESRPARVSEHEALGRAYGALLSIAAEFQVVVHAVQHVNREGQQYANEGKRLKRPTLSDIRGGGNAEGRSHVVIFPYRPYVDGTPEQQREGYFIIAKNRDGEAGEIEMTYSGSRHLWLQRGTLVPWFELEKLPRESEIA